MYVISLAGNTRYAEFTYDPETNTLKRTAYEEIEPTEKSDCLNVVIQDQAENLIISEPWMVLHGKPWEITVTIRDKYPIAKLSTKSIYDHLDSVGRNEDTTVTYSIKEISPILAATKQYKALINCRQMIISKMFDIPFDEITVVQPDPEGQIW